MRFEPAPTQAVVLVGGLGTRLSGLTGGLPKPMVQVGGRPFLSYLLWHAGRFGFDRVLLLSGHRAEAITEHAQALAPPGVAVDVIVEPRPLGTAGALRFAAERFDDRVLLLNGDSLFDFNWLDLLAVQDDQAAVVLSLRREADASRFGVVETTGERVTGFRERGDGSGGLINAGVYLVRRRVAEACPQEGSFERDVLPTLAAAGEVCGRQARGFFLDIGVPDALRSAQTLVPDSQPRGAVFFERDVLVEPAAVLIDGSDSPRWAPGAVEAVKAVNDSGRFAFFLASRSAVAPDPDGRARVRALSADMDSELRRLGAHFDAVPPQGASGHGGATTKLLPDLLAQWPVDRSRSVMIGTHSTDLTAATAAGIQGILYGGGDIAAHLERLLA